MFSSGHEIVTQLFTNLLALLLSRGNTKWIFPVLPINWNIRECIQIALLAKICLRFFFFLLLKRLNNFDFYVVCTVLAKMMF